MKTDEEKVGKQQRREEYEQQQRQEAPKCRKQLMIFICFQLNYFKQHLSKESSKKLSEIKRQPLYCILPLNITTQIFNQCIKQC